MTQRRTRPSGEDLPPGYQFGDNRTSGKPDRMYLGGGVWRPMHLNAADRLRPVGITDNGFSVTVPEYETGRDPGDEHA